MKTQLLLLLLILVIIGCAPSNEAYITPNLEGGNDIEPATPSSGKHLLIPLAEAVESDEQGEEVIQTTKDQIKPLPSLISIEPSPDVTLIQPAGIVDLGEVEEERTDSNVKPLEEMPNPQLAKPMTTLVEKAKQKLATKLGIDIGFISLVSSAVVESSDGNINCQANNGGRQPLKMTFVYQITLEATGNEYIYYAEPGGTLSFCEER